MRTLGTALLATLLALPLTAQAPARTYTISGTAIAINGELAQFREDNGSTVTVNERALLRSHAGLYTGGHYALRGYWSNNMFVAQADLNGGYAGNGFPFPGSNASVSGSIIAVSNNRVTIMQGLFSSITIDDQQAIYNGTAQNLYVGRTVTAYGYWSGTTFYATSIG
jgi:hypothetical protein